MPRPAWITGTITGGSATCTPAVGVTGVSTSIVTTWWRAQRLVDEEAGELLEVAPELGALGGLVPEAREALHDERVVDDRHEHGGEPTGG